MIDLARTSSDPDERANFFEHDAGCRELGVTIGTDWSEMRIGENAWFRFATVAKGAAFRFRVHGRGALTCLARARGRLGEQLAEKRLPKNGARKIVGAPQMNPRNFFAELKGAALAFRRC